MPKLQQGFTDALAKLRELAANKNAILSDPDGAIARAVELKGQIASGFGIQFQSGKYQKQAASEIAAKSIEADSIIAGIRQFAKKAFSAKELDGRIVGEFASGTYMSPEFLRQYSDFKRRNGMMPGAFTRRDTLPSLIADSEMVLNPRQIANVISAVGDDPFQYAGIPNYPSKPKTVKGYAEGNYFGTSAPNVSRSQSGGEANNNQPMVMQFTFEHSIDAEGMIKTQLKNSSSVQKEVKIIVEDKYANSELTLKKR